MGWCYDSVALFLIFSNKTCKSLTYFSRKKQSIGYIYVCFGLLLDNLTVEVEKQKFVRIWWWVPLTIQLVGSAHLADFSAWALAGSTDSPLRVHMLVLPSNFILRELHNTLLLFIYLLSFAIFHFLDFFYVFPLDALGLVWYIHSNTCFQFLNNIIHISTHVFKHMFSVFKCMYQTPS